MSNVRLRLAVDTAAAAGSFAASVLLLLRRDWIEFVFGVDPDHRSGSAEWLILGILLAVALIGSVRASREWRRLRTVQGSAP